MQSSPRWLADYHIHSNISFDGESSIDEMRHHAVDLGIAEIGFSEHVEFQPEDPGYGFFNYERYSQLVEHARVKYEGKLTIRKGVEVDYHPEYEMQTRKWLGSKAISSI